METASGASFMMVGRAPEDCQRPVQLFCKKKSDHLMREGHFTERKKEACLFPQFRIKSERPSHDKYQVFTAGDKLLVQEIGKFYRTEGGAPFVQQHHGIPRKQLVLDQFCLSLLLLQLSKGCSIFQGRDLMDGKWHIMADAGFILPDACPEPWFFGAACNYQGDLHKLLQRSEVWRKNL